MNMVERMEREVKDAMLARDNERRDALRLLLSSLRSAEKDLQRPLSDDEELQVLQRERKKRIEAADAFHAAGREEQAEKEEVELEILEEFMPEPLGEEDAVRKTGEAVVEGEMLERAARATDGVRERDHDRADAVDERNLHGCFSDQHTRQRSSGRR